MAEHDKHAYVVYEDCGCGFGSEGSTDVVVQDDKLTVTCLRCSKIVWSARRYPERDNERTVTDRARIGQEARARQIVAYAGYATCGHTLRISDEDIRDRMAQLLTAHVSMNIDDAIQKVKGKYYNDQPRWLVRALWNEAEYRIRGERQRSLYRSLWHIPADTIGTIIGTVRCLTGRRYPPSMDSDGVYDPPALVSPVHHSLYVIQVDLQDYWTSTMSAGWRSRTFLVHPDDIEEVNQ